jgi:pilus assembly protein Flp/PilA
MTALRKTGRFLARFRRAQDGATAIEYALIAVGIGVAVAATVFTTGANLKKNYYDKIEAETKK